MDALDPLSITMPNLPEGAEEDGEEDRTSSPGKLRKSGAAVSPPSKTVRRTGRVAKGKATPSPKIGRRAASSARAGDRRAEGTPSELESVGPSEEGESTVSRARAQSEEETMLADDEDGLPREPTLEYSAGSQVSDEEEAEEPEAQQEDEVPQGLRRQPRQAGFRVNKPVKRSPAQTRERSPIAAESMPSLAQTVLVEAPRQYVDKPPPRAKEDEPRPPKRVPADPPAPSPEGSAKELSASSTAAALRAAQAEAPAVVKRKTYGGTLEGGKFVRAQADSVDELSAQDKQAILEDLLTAKQKREQELKDKQKLHKARKQREEAAKADKRAATISEAEALEQERQHRKVKELKKWLKKKEEETKARKARDAEMLKMVMEKESQKSETIKKMEKERLAQREKRLRQAELQRAHLEAKLLLSREAGKMDVGQAAMDPHANMAPPGTMLPAGLAGPALAQPDAAMMDPGYATFLHEQQYLQQHLMEAQQQQFLLQQQPQQFPMHQPPPQVPVPLQLPLQQPMEPSELAFQQSPPDDLLGAQGDPSRQPSKMYDGPSQDPSRQPSKMYGEPVQDPSRQPSKMLGGELLQDLSRQPSHISGAQLQDPSRQPSHISGAQLQDLSRQPSHMVPQSEGSRQVSHVGPLPQASRQVSRVGSMQGSRRPSHALGSEPYNDPSRQPSKMHEGFSQDPSRQPSKLAALPEELALGLQYPQESPIQHYERLHRLRASGQPRAQRVVHRHIHHHVHYHEGSDPESGGEEQRLSPAQFTASPEQQRQIEMASEARVRAQLEADPQYGPGLAQSASAGSLQPSRMPSMQRSASVPGGGGFAPGATRSQEAALRRSTLPALEMDLGRRASLARYKGNVQRAIGSYSDSGRPRFARATAMG